MTLAAIAAAIDNAAVQSATNAADIAKRQIESAANEALLKISHATGSVSADVPDVGLGDPIRDGNIPY